MSRSKIKYTQAIPHMTKEFGYHNKFQMPRIEKIVLSMGLSKNSNFEKMEEFMKVISCQKPIKTIAKKSIAQFNIRTGIENGFKVTLRGKNMYDFLDRFYIALLNDRKFLGLNNKSINCIDNKSQISIGISNIRIFHIVFPKDMNKDCGLNVTICTNANKKEMESLLKHLNFPFKK